MHIKITHRFLCIYVHFSICYGRGGPAKVFCGHGESLAKVKYFFAKNGNSLKKEFCIVSHRIHCTRITLYHRVKPMQLPKPSTLLSLINVASSEPGSGNEYCISWSRWRVPSLVEPGWIEMIRGSGLTMMIPHIKRFQENSPGGNCRVYDLGT